jgi:hypothetical protein
MATPAQIAANRANAQRSTGPRTEEGKLSASQNALRHGLCSGIPIMHDEGDLNYDHLLDALREEFQPVSPNEEILVYKMAEHFFYGKRAAYLLAEQLDSNDGGDDNAREIGLMMRYHAASDRGYYRALSELRKVQKERPLQEIGSVSSTAGTAAEDCLPSPAEPGEIGSVSQNPATQPTAPTHFDPKDGVCVTSAREDNRATYPPNQTRASRETSVNVLPSASKTAPVSPQKAA